jgi:uncharacterized membrane protein YqgA involved in biofilm formation
MGELSLARCHHGACLTTLRHDMLGTLLNAGAILLGGFIGTATRLDIAAPRQQQLKVLLGVATTFFGLKLVWTGLASTGTARGFFRQLAVVLVAMVVGHLIGKLCRIQSLFNRLGHDAKLKLERATTNPKKSASDGLMAATLLFCAAPLGIVGALEDGIHQYYAPLAIKAVMDGVAAISFARMFGWTAMLAALPVAAFLCGVTLLGVRLAPWLEAQQVLGVFHASAGLVMTYVTLVIFEVKKVEIANYLPSLIAAPLLLKLWYVVFGT